MPAPSACSEAGAKDSNPWSGMEGRGVRRMLRRWRCVYIGGFGGFEDCSWLGCCLDGEDRVWEVDGIIVEWV